MGYIIRALSLLVVLLQLISCSSEEECGYQPEELEFSVELNIQRLENEMLELKTREKVSRFMEKEPLITKYFLLRDEYPNDSIFITEMVRRFNNPHIDTLKMEINRIFPDMSKLEREFEEAFSLLNHYYPEVTIPQIKTVATGFDYDLFVSDTLIVVGLDYYLGEDSKYRPMQTYNYILQRYKPKYIVPSVMLLYGISSDFNDTNKEDISVLSDMISYGKSFYFSKRMLPCTPDSILIWYSDVEMNGARENEKIIWSHFLRENLLWESSHLVKKKYLDERPKTFEISPDCPPRIGTWLGWQIVKEYMKSHPEVTLQELMSNQDAKRIFDESEYRPG
ncbi:MAG: gliding motility lipoprotein GldB [Cyclobacteriaceae bacterium]|nr:gliding motility lipoprotein GldB [Cyclobacteriaceae bacterium]